MAKQSDNSLSQNPGATTPVNTPNVLVHSVLDEMDQSVPQEAPAPQQQQQQAMVAEETTPTCDVPVPQSPACSTLSGTNTPFQQVDVFTTPSYSPSSSAASSPTSDTTDMSSQPSNVFVPGVLQSMYKEGAVFRTATYCWTVSNDSNIRINRESSLCFSLNVQASSVEVLEALHNAAGIESQDVSCIQYNSSNHLWTVSFFNTETKYQVMGLHQIAIKGHQCFLSDCDCENL